MDRKIPKYLEGIHLNTDFNHRDELEYWLKEFDIQKNEICLYGSLPLHIAGIRENGDVDFLMTSKTKKRILPKVKSNSNCKTDWKIEFGDNIHTGPLHKDRFDYFGLTNEMLIYDEKYHMVIDGYKIFRLELTLSKKANRKRDKDLKDVKLIEKSGIIGAPGWNWDLVFSLPPWKKQHMNYWDPVENFVKFLQEKPHIKKYLAGEIMNLFKKLDLNDVIDNFYSVCDNFSKAKNIYEFKNHHSFFQVKLPISVILSNYINEDGFCGWDIFLEYLLESRETNGIDDKEIKKKIIENINIKEDHHHPITISKNGLILKGSSTFINKIIDGNYMIEIEIENTSVDKSKNKNKINKINLTDDQEKLLKNKAIDFFEKTGLIFYSIMWPPAQDIFEDIEKYIKKRVKVISSKQYDLTHNFSRIVHDLYVKDARAKDWKIEKKINTMLKEKKVLNVSKIWLPEPDYRYMTKKSHFSKITRDLKNDVRKEFHNRIDDYEWDNLIHMTETYKHNYQTYKVLEKIDEL